MSFNVRSIQAAVAALQATRPEQPLNSGKAEHHDNAMAWSFGKLKGWPSSPPVSTLYQQNNPLRTSAKVLSAPKSLVDYCNFEAVGTWNAKGHGRWLASPNEGDWIIVLADLQQEQFDPDADEDFGGGQVAVAFALWRVTEGYAAAVWNKWDTATLASLIGLDAWPAEGWADVSVWYGE